MRPDKAEHAEASERLAPVVAGPARVRRIGAKIVDRHALDAQGGEGSGHPGPRSGSVAAMDTAATVSVAARRRELNRKLRLAFIAGSEERWQLDHGRPMTVDELRRVLRRYPGDLPER